MGNLPPHMLEQVRMAQERARATDDDVQAAPSKRARLAFLQAVQASSAAANGGGDGGAATASPSASARATVDPSLAGLECFLCRTSMAPISGTDTRVGQLMAPCRHALHIDCECAQRYLDFLAEEEKKEAPRNSESDSGSGKDDGTQTCPCCHQSVETQQTVVATQIPRPADDKKSAVATGDGGAEAPTESASALEADDPSMEDILQDIRGKLWDSNHKVVSASLRMLVQIVHSDIDSDCGDDESDETDDEDDKEDYSDLVLRIGMPVVLIYCISRHGDDHADVPKMVLGILEWLASREPAACKAILPRIDGSLLRIVESMRRNPGDGSLQYTGLQVLGRLAGGRTRLALNSAGAVEATFQAMLHHKENALVQDSALQLLERFARGSDFAARAVAGHDAASRARHAQCVAGSLLCVSRDATGGTDAVAACGRLILCLVPSDAEFRAALHRVAGAPIKQVFANFGQDPALRALFREVLRSLVTKAPGDSVTTATAAAATTTAPDDRTATGAPETLAPAPSTTGDDDRKPAALLQKPEDDSGTP